MRILHVVPRYPPSIGGSEVWAAGLARWQRAQGHEVDVLTLRAVQDDELWGEGPVLPAPVAVGSADSDRGVRVRRFPHRRLGPGARWLLWRLRLSSLSHCHSPALYGVLLREARAVDIIHAHTVPGPHLCTCWLSARAARKPLVLTPHFHAGDPVHEQAPYRWLLRHADAVFAVSSAETSALAARKVPPDRIVTTSNAIDTPTLVDSTRAKAVVRGALSVPAHASLVTFLGRKVASKGVELLLQAMTLSTRRPPPVLALAGPATAWYRALGDRIRGDNIRDLPPLPEAAKFDLLAASDLLVLPSKSEAFGIVLLEAWAAGTPVLGADIPPVREVIGDGGLTFRPDDAADLAARIDQMLASPDEARAMAERGGRKIRAQYTWERVGSTVMTGYTLAASRRARCRATP